MKKNLFLISCLGLTWHAQSSFAEPVPIYPAAILGHDLMIRGIGWMGHVGIATAGLLKNPATHVIEVLDEMPVIQSNTLDIFRARPHYWGSRTGLSVDPDITMAILKEAQLQKDFLCAKYTKWPISKPSEGHVVNGNQYRCTVQGIFRCDTFINYLYAHAGIHIPYRPPILPTAIFKAFPLGNQDGRYAMKKPLDHAQLIRMSLDEFILQIEQWHGTDVRYLLSLLTAPDLSLEKQVLIVEKIGLIGDVRAIPIFISHYQSTPRGQGTPLREALLSAIQIAYQEAKCTSSTASECADIRHQLRQFYEQQLQDGIEKTPRTIEAFTRGILQLDSTQAIRTMHEQLHALIDDQSVHLPADVRFILKYELFTAVPESSEEYLVEILQLLETENRIDLQSAFHFYLVMSMHHSQQTAFSANASVRLKGYLERVQDQYENTQVSVLLSNQSDPFRFGKWLEAKALIATANFDEACAYIAQYLITNVSFEQQPNYLIGFSDRMIEQLRANYFSTLNFIL